MLTCTAKALIFLLALSLSSSVIIPDKECQKILCPKDTVCSKGKCVEPVQEAPLNLTKIVTCPAVKDLKPILCGNPRPTLQECPQIMYIRQPDPEICGVSMNGAKKNFVMACTACMDKTVDYYYEKPCYETPFICESQQKCDGGYCKGHACKIDSDCPYDWQTCSSNICIDPCQKLNCKNCKFGMCNYVKPNGLCVFDSDCDFNWSCVGFECKDMCLTTPCLPGQKCERGECVPIPDTKPK